MKTKKNTVKLKIQLMMLSSLFIQSLVYAASVGTAFTYQGQLLDQGQPANQEYDITIQAFHQEFGGVVQKEAEFLDVTVTDGLFTIPQVDFGDSLFDGSEVWLELSVRVAGAGSYDVLQPRQRVSAAPYAVQADYAVDATFASQAQDAVQAQHAAQASNATQAQNAVQAQSALEADSLASNGANTDDVLQFDGNNWVPQALAVDSYWSNDVTNPSDIHYLGGDVGIGSIFPSAKLHVFGGLSDEAFIVNVGNQPKLTVHDNGGLSVGTPLEAPLNGLKVQGDTELQGDLVVQGNTVQALDNNGMMKFMVHAWCGGGAPSIIKSYNGVNSDAVSIIDAPSTTGACFITFPFEIHNRFWQASAVLPSNDELRGASCKVMPNNNTLMKCFLFKSSNGTGVWGGEIMVHIY